MAERRADPSREAALRLLLGIAQDGAYANLLLPRLLAERGLTGRDAALATELAYGTARTAGTLDVILAECVDRPLGEVDTAAHALLQLGAYQLLRTRIPPHAAVATTVDLARATGNGRAAGFLNAVLRRVSAHDWATWTDRVTAGQPALNRLAAHSAHPLWIAEAFAAALAGTGGTGSTSGTGGAGGIDLAETQAALAADDERPVTHLVAWPGQIERDELAAAAGGTPGPYSPYAVRMGSGGEPAALAAIRQRRAGVQDEGSQLCALALAKAPLTGRDERWLDLCAGPGGKTALLAALATGRGARVTAIELHPHRAELVRRATRAWTVEPAETVEVIVADALEWEPAEGGYDRVLLDAPCTGLGALRRRPEARWRRTPADVDVLAALQRSLLARALRLVRPGGVVAYVTCSPHPAETVEVVAGGPTFDARPSFAGVPMLGDGPAVQLWPHRHGTDAMFAALLRG